MMTPRTIEGCFGWSMLIGGAGALLALLWLLALAVRGFSSFWVAFWALLLAALAGQG